MPDQQPSVGRVVHYRSHGTPVRDDGTQAYPPECRAAIITEIGGLPEIPPGGPDTGTPVDSDIQTVGLAVFNPTGIFLNRGVPYDANGAGGTWHWPERV